MTILYFELTGGVNVIVAHITGQYVLLFLIYTVFSIISSGIEPGPHPLLMFCKWMCGIDEKTKYYIHQ